jgi:hypothetical protein
MQPAANEATLFLGDATTPLRLRASLRAAVYLNRKYGDAKALIDFISAGSVTATADLIGATVTDKGRWIFARDRLSIKDILDARDQLIEFVLVLFGVNASGTESTEPSEPITHEEFFNRLFKIGAGWLQWPPESVWNASIDEILLARDGLMDKLKAIHGSGEEISVNAKDGLSDDLKAELNAIGDMGVTSMPARAE